MSVGNNNNELNSFDAMGAQGVSILSGNCNNAFMRNLRHAEAINVTPCNSNNRAFNPLAFSTPENKHNIEGFTQKDWIAANLKVELFEELLRGYHDQEIVQFFKFGWPTDAKNVAINKSIPPNQKGARSNPAKVREYLKAETREGLDHWTLQ